MNQREPRRRVGSVCEVVTDRPIFHISFDDGPHPEVTPPILDILDDRGVRATFFLLVEHVRRYPEVAERIVERGHEVGLHGMSHQRLSTAPWRTIVEEVVRAKQRLERMLRRPVWLFRPPYGDHGLRSLTVARAAGMKTILWSVDTCDWRGINHEEAVDEAVAAARPGGILLMHDTPIGESLTDEMERGLIPRDRLATMVLERLMERRLRSLPLADLLAAGPQIRRFRPETCSAHGVSGRGKYPDRR